MLHCGSMGYAREEFLKMSAADLRRADERRDFCARARWLGVSGVFSPCAQGTASPIDIDGVGHLVGCAAARARLVVITTSRTGGRRSKRWSGSTASSSTPMSGLRALSATPARSPGKRSADAMARDLHDDIGQALTALKIQVESLPARRRARARARIAEKGWTPSSTRWSGCGSFRSACGRRSSTI